MKRIALDMDAVLANIQPVAFDLLEGDDHDRTADEVESWSWGLEEYGKERYLTALWHTWTLRPDSIKPCEEHLWAITGDIHACADQLDVVTSHPDHPGIRESKRQWLEEYNICFDTFRSVNDRTPKSEFYYNIFIDDKPGLADTISPDQTLYLIDRPWNQSVVERDNVIRVKTVSEARFPIKF